MQHPSLRRLAPTLALTALLAACGAGDPAADTGGADTDTAATPVPTEAPADATPPAFPVTVAHDGGELTLDAAPTAIVSLSPAATETLFAIGAGDQVVAVDSFSNFPAEAPLVDDLSAFEPSAEAILGLEPDLVIAAYDANDLVAQLEAVGVPVLLQSAPPTVDLALDQWIALGDVTGNTQAATTLADAVATELAELGADEPGAGLTYYHELDASLFTATSDTFIGEIYAIFGLENIADPADADGAAFGYPQLSAEYVVDADPDLVLLACTVYCGETAETFAARDGFGGLSAVAAGDVVELDDDVASRWGPRIAELARTIDAAVTAAAD